MEGQFSQLAALRHPLWKSKMDFHLVRAWLHVFSLHLLFLRSLWLLRGIDLALTIVQRSCRPGRLCERHYLITGDSIPIRKFYFCPFFVVFCRYRCFCRFKLFETRGFTFAPSPACAIACKDLRGRDRRWFPSAKRYGCYSSKADVGRALGVSERHGGVVVDWRYVDNAGRQPNRPGQNYDARSSIREPALQAPRAPLPPVAPRARGGRRPAVRDQDRLRARIHRWEPYVSKYGAIL